MTNKPYGLDALKCEFRFGNDGDSWGACMAWLFAIADALTFHFDETVPSDWGFRPSPMGPDEDQHECQFLICCEPEAVIEFGDMMWRLRGILKSQGRSY